MAVAATSCGECVVNYVRSKDVCSYSCAPKDARTYLIVRRDLPLTLGPEHRESCAIDVAVGVRP